MIEITPQQNSYELLDSGMGEKLERFGDFVLSRPDPEALWQKNNPEIWERANLTYIRKGASGSWKGDKNFPKNWNIEYGDLTFELRPTSFKHVGIFPEQLSHWVWLEKKLKAKSQKQKAPRVLNLFAYTGGASLVCAKAGAEVTHVDSSKVAIDWARKNAEISGLKDAPIRWIEDDVLKFLRREVKRGNKYDVIIMDPPAFGHGKGGALWKIEKDFFELFSLIEKVLSDSPIALVINGYTAGYSPMAFSNNLLSIKNKFGGKIELGELAIKENGLDRLLPAGIFARWEAF